MENTGYKHFLKNKNFLAYLSANVINRFGDSLDSIAFTWIIYAITGSAFWSALIFGINRLPTIFLQPFLGVLADKMNKRVVMIATDIIRGICVLYIGIGVMQGFLNEWSLLAATLIISTAEAFRMPAAASMIPQLLDIEDYEYGVALDQGLSGTTELIGMLSAGFIIGLFGVQTAVFIDMATFFICAFILLFVKLKPIEKKETLNLNYFENLKAGFRLVKTNHLIMYMIFLAVFLNALSTPFNSLQAPLVSEILHAKEIMLSVIGISFATGGIFGSFLFPKVNERVHNVVMVKAGGLSLVLMYLCPVLIGNFIQNELVRYILVFIYGVGVGVCVALINTFIGVITVKSIKPEFLGRVKSILGALAVASMPIVSFIISGLVFVFSTEVIFVATGLLSLVCYFTICSKKTYNRMVKVEDIQDEDGNN